MIKTVIIDDERACRESLKSMLGYISDDFEVAGMADGVETGYELIREIKPRLIFLDIMMPPSDGFTLLKRFQKIDFEIIFTTAYSEFALQAIRASAMDYLLKPIVADELKNALDRMGQKIRNWKKDTTNSTSKLAIPTQESFIFISPDDILWAETTDDRKSRLKLKDNRELIVPKSFGDIEEMLEGQNFFRIHRSYIINMSAITKYYPDKAGGCVILSDGKLLPIASRKKQEFLQRIGY